MSATPALTIVGRDDQLRALRDELDDVQSRGRLIRLLGEPGIGKSAVQTLVAEHARGLGFSVLGAHGCQSEAHLPFASLHQLLQPLLTRANRLPPRQREALFACFGMSETAEVNPFFASLAVLELLADAAAEMPVLLCLDDLHWMDQPSIDALSFVARRIATERIGILCTTRNDSLPFATDEQVTSFVLDGLDETASAALLRSQAPDLAPMLRDRVLRQAGGNPLAILEFASALMSGRLEWPELDEALPMTTRLERAFVGRADELAPAPRAVLDLAALDDGENLNEVVAAAAILHGAPIDLTAVEPAVGLGLLTVTGDNYRITHPLVRSALRHAMSQTTRRQAHTALALVLSAEPQRAIWHRAAAVSGPDEQIAAELEAAATAAHRRGAVSMALPCLERAAALSADPNFQAARLLSAAEVAYELGRFAQVEQLTARISQMTLQPREHSRLTLLNGVFHDGSASEPADILHLVDLARRASSERDSDLAMQLLIGAGRRVWWRDPGEPVRSEIVRAAHDIAVPAHDPRLLAVLGLADSLSMSSVILNQLVRWPGDADGRPDLAGLLGIAAFCIGDHGRAVTHLTAAIDALRAQGRMAMLAEALTIRAWAEINLGMFDGSNSADEAMRLADETGQAVWTATARIAMALIDAVKSGSSGRSELLAHAEQAALQMPNASSSLLAGAQLTRGIAALGADRPEPAYGELHRVFVPTDPAHQRVQQLWTLSYIADAAVRTGRQAEAESLLRSAERLTGPFPAQGPLIAFEYSRAVLADRNSAETLFRIALAGAASSFPWHRARLELAYGSWLRRERRVLESRAPLRAARSAFDALSAHPWALRADGELRATGERGWRPMPSLRDQLTSQEAQIAALAAQGLSNRDIGERLFLSHRTVSSHLYRTFPKLGITSRGQLAGALAGQGEPGPTGRHGQSFDASHTRSSP